MTTNKIKNEYVCEAEKLSEYGEDPSMLTEDSGISLTKPKDITPENIKDNIISDDELRQKIINGELVDEKLEATLFPNGKPSK